MIAATELRLVYIAPALGTSGVGDYADDFLSGITPRVAEVRQLRHAGPGRERMRDVLRTRRELRGILAEQPSRPTVIHTEQSGGAITPFWAAVGLRGVTATATVHDAPFSVWWPFRTRAIARSRILNHGLHRGLFGLMNRIERRVNRSRTLFTLTPLGAERLAATMPESTIVASRQVVPARRDLQLVTERPLAVGFFGYVYRGKGFDALAELRAALPSDIAIRVAGRGTAALPPITGVEFLGEVVGAAEDDFFDSIRALLVPYSGRRQYGIEVVVSSSVIARSLAYQTPVIALKDGALVAGTPGVVVVAGGPAALAARADALVRDDRALGELQRAACEVRSRDSADHIAQTFLDTWEGLL